MKLKMTALFLGIVLLMTFVAACGASSGPLTEEKAYAIVYKHAGINGAEVEDPHLHVVAENGTPKYNIHFTLDGVEYNYDLHAQTGEILSHTP